MSESTPRPPITAAPIRLPRVVREFLDTETAGGAVLVVAAAVALVWANSPWRGAYEDLWHTNVAVHVGSFSIEEDLRHWVNDALMSIFFLVVGLEEKRELVLGELRTLRRAALPAVGAVGGMVVPAAIFLALNAGEPGASGWGVPMATDIAFAVGILALLGPRVPPGLKVFLLSLAIADDIGAIAVIAVFYSGTIHTAALLIAILLIAMMIVLRILRADHMLVVAVIGTGVWLAVYESGLHATIAGVVLGILAPARPRTSSEVAREWAASLGDEPTVAETETMTKLARSSVSVAERLEHQLHPVSSFVIVPIFALANAGVLLETDALANAGAGRVAIGVVLGLLVGKTVGIALATRVAMALRVGVLPDGVTWPQIVAVGAVAGIGFTVSLFIAELAFDTVELVAAAKLGILAASLLASLGGLVLLAVTLPKNRSD